jgi:hypothetical protein
MDAEKLAIDLLLKGMTEEQQKAALDSIKESVSKAKAIQKQRIGENVQVVVQALKKIESDIRSRYDDLGNKIEARVRSIKDGKDGKDGKNGANGRDGRDGSTGPMGPKGKDGLNGRDGKDGSDGVSITDAHIDFDGSLIISLSSGRTINVGEVVAPDIAEKIKVITNGGGTSQSVLDTLASLQAQIDAIDTFGAVSYQGTWNASTNTPTIVAGTGTKGYYYVVSVAGSTSIDGQSLWGVGDWIIFNGSVWQKVDGGNTANLTDLIVNTSTTLDYGTANQVQYLNASKLLVGSSNLTFNGTTLVANDLTDSSLTSGRVTYAGTGGNLVDSANLTFNGTTLTAAAFSGPINGTVGATSANTGNFTTLTTSSTVTHNGGTANGVAYLNGSKVLTTGSALTFDGTNFGVGGSAPYNLTVNAADNNGALIKSGNDSHTGFLYFGDTASNTVGALSYDHSNNSMRFQTAGSEQARLTSTGLGIGTSSPGVKLDVVGELRTQNTSPAGITVKRTDGVNANGWLNFVGSDDVVDGSVRMATDVANALTFLTASTERLRIDSSGNLGLGVTPSAWGTSEYKAIQIGNGASVYGRVQSGDQDKAGLSSNAYNNGSGWLYIATDSAANYTQIGGGHYWYTAPSGTAGNAITFTQAMTLDANGNLGVGATSLSSGNRITVDGGGVHLVSTAFNSQGLTLGASTSSIDWRIADSGASTYALTFGSVSGGTTTERMRIDSSGNLLVGTTSGSNLMTVRRNATTAGSNAQFISENRTGTSGQYALYGTRFDNGSGSGFTPVVFGAVQTGSAAGRTADFVIAVASSDNVDLSTQERARIDSSGNLGIGTSSPADILHISKAGDLYLRVANTSTGINAYLGQDSNGTYIGNTGASVVRFIQGSSERARIDTSGNLLVGTTSSSGLITGIQASTSTYSGYFTSNYTASGNASIMFWGRNGGAVAAAVRYKDATTSMEFYSPTGHTVAYTTSSDYRLKENIQPMGGALAKVTALRPVTYKWKEGFGKGSSQGFIAHELQSVVPEAVTGEKDAVDADGNPIYQGIDTSFLVATLTAAIQELKAEFDAYKATHP